MYSLAELEPEWTSSRIKNIRRRCSTVVRAESVDHPTRCHATWGSLGWLGSSRSTACCRSYPHGARKWGLRREP